MAHDEHELWILQEIERNPTTTQADLAAQLDVAVGTINFVIKRLIRKGYVRVTQLDRRRFRYIVTPAGIVLRSKLAMASIKYSMRLYNETRAQAKRLIAQTQQQNFQQIVVRGASELAEVVMLTGLEMNVLVVTESSESNVPVITIDGTRLVLELPQSSECKTNSAR